MFYQRRLNRFLKSKTSPSISPANPHCKYPSQRNAKQNVPNLSDSGTIFFISDKVWPMVVRHVYNRYSFTPLPTDFLKAKRPESA